MFKTGVRTRDLAEFPGARTIPARELAVIRSLATPVEVPKGRVLMRQGAPGSESFFVVTGEVLVERDGEPVAVLGPGSLVGEAALLGIKPRNATVTATSDLVVAAMSRREFTTVLDRCPTIARKVLQTAVGRAGTNVQ